MANTTTPNTENNALAVTPAQSALDKRNAEIAAAGEFGDLIEDAGKGSEALGPNDVKPQRLKICQSGSPERKPDDPKQIKGLNELDLFNSLSGEIYGRDLDIIIIKALGSRWVELNPIDEGGGVKDFNVPHNDPRTKWRMNPETGKEDLKPIATEFYDYLVFLPEHKDVCALSFKSTQIKAAKELNSKTKLPLKIEVNGVKKVFMNPPVWAKTYHIRTEMQKDGQYSWGGFNISQKEITPPELRAFCRQLAAEFDGKNVIIDVDDDAREPEDGSGDTSYNPPDGEGPNDM